jgi:hypothetical protein
MMQNSGDSQTMLFSIVELTRVLRILEKFTVKKILFPFDGPDNPLRAVKYASTLAQDIPSVQIFFCTCLIPSRDA